MTHSCYSKTNLDILWVKSVGSVQAFQDPVVFLVCLSGKQFCFVLWRSPFQHTVQFLPPQGPRPALPFSSFRAFKNAECHLTVAKAASGGWRFILIHARLRTALLSLSISSACEPSSWVVLLTWHPVHVQRQSFAWGIWTQCPDFNHEQKASFVSIKMKA